MAQPFIEFGRLALENQIHFEPFYHGGLFRPAPEKLPAPTFQPVSQNGRPGMTGNGPSTTDKRLGGTPPIEDQPRINVGDMTIGFNREKIRTPTEWPVTRFIFHQI